MDSEDHTHDLTQTYQNWMTNLPVHLQNTPLNLLAIPGSHNSCTKTLDLKGPISPDQPDIVKKLGPFAKNVVYNWSLTQSSSIIEQLNAGIRYFDLRICSMKKITPLFTFHGLYSCKIFDFLDHIDDFISKHPKEIIILDFNHFIDVAQQQHNDLMDYMLKTFKSKICPKNSANNVTLSKLWSENQQLIILYDSGYVCNKTDQFWNNSRISSPYADTNSITRLITFLILKLSAGRPDDVFYVSQLVLTPTVSNIMKGLCSSLKKTLISPNLTKFKQWIHQQSAGNYKGGVNVIIADFIDQDFINSVIQMNYDKNFREE